MNKRKRGAKRGGKDTYPDFMAKFPQLKEPETPLNPALQMSEDEEEEERN